MILKVADLIRFLLANFTLTLADPIGVIAAAIALSMRKPRPWSRAEPSSRPCSPYFLLFSIGVSFFYNFVIHVFFGEMAARFIGWADSPFQTEVGYASLGFSHTGLSRLQRQSRHALGRRHRAGRRFYGGLRPATSAISPPPATPAPGNAGVILYTDIIIPLIGFALIWLERGRRGWPRA